MVNEFGGRIFHEKTSSSAQKYRLKDQFSPKFPKFSSRTFWQQLLTCGMQPTKKSGDSTIPVNDFDD